MCFVGKFARQENVQVVAQLLLITSIYIYSE